MGTDRSCTDLSLVSLRLLSTSVTIFKEVSQGGQVAIRFVTELQTPENKLVDRDNPAGLTLTVTISGQEKAAQEKAEQAEKAFVVSATMIGKFRPRMDKPLTADEYAECYEWVATQVYLPLREYLLYTLRLLAINLRLPLTVPSNKDSTVPERGD